MESTSYCTVGELRCLVEKGAWPQREMLLVLAQTAGEFDVLTEFDELMSGFRAAPSSSFLSRHREWCTGGLSTAAKTLSKACSTT